MQSRPHHDQPHPCAFHPAPLGRGPASLCAMALGAWSLTRLPIDAVPDITNKQVQVNTSALALSPAEIEKQVTFRIETALAGIPGLDNTRSISRNGFSQVTAMFTEKTDIYFARQQVGERLLELRPNSRPGVEPKMGPISTGLGEIYMWTVSFARRAATGVYVTPEGDAAGNRCRARRLPAHGAGLDRASADQERAGRRRSRFYRRLRQAVSGAAGSRRSSSGLGCRSATWSRPSRPTM